MNANTVLRQVAKSLCSKIVGNSVLKQGLSTSAARKKDAQPKGKRQKIGVQGAGFDRGQPKPGVENGPDIIRSSGFIDFLREEIGHDVFDFGDINFGLQPRKPETHSSSGGIQLRNVSEVAKANHLISESTAKIMREGRVCLTLGGDHSLAIGTLHGASSVVNDLAVLWVDAHADINSLDSTTTGNLHGMPLSFLIKEFKPSKSLPEFSWVTPRISAANIAYIGLRSVDPGEREILNRLGITVYSMRDVDRLGIVEVTKRALDKITSGFKKPCHVSFDIDALDDNEIGSNTGTPVIGGLTVREGMTLLEEVYETVNVVSMDLVEVNPLLGDPQAVKRTSLITKHLLGSAFGYDRGGLAKPF